MISHERKIKETVAEFFKNTQHVIDNYSILRKHMLNDKVFDDDCCIFEAQIAETIISICENIDENQSLAQQILDDLINGRVEEV